MKISTGICLLSALFLLYLHTHHCIRHKRDISDMSEALWCYREKVRTPLLGINMYGCFCGIGGSGHPQDEVDRCCFLHDCCYQYANLTFNCDSSFQPYKFSCKRSQIKCKASGVCAQMSCECDKKFAECLTTAKPKDKHFFFNGENICTKPTEICPAIYPSMAAITRRAGKVTGGEELKVSLD
ncbi:hypothetical protein XELAEV_18021941mg [Xenopus laevis]|uniref:Phospholipase A2 n=1 Tax=Xenopus laevis TaxID=8355 RepID=A0A974D418_XENLA|nr:hypothetical protein XELAEV_18021941mg [Xenopus laevis]